MSVRGVDDHHIIKSKNKDISKKKNENYTRSEVQRSVSKQKFEYASYTDKLVKRY